MLHPFLSEMVENQAYVKLFSKKGHRLYCGYAQKLEMNHVLLSENKDGTGDLICADLLYVKAVRLTLEPPKPGNNYFNTH